MIYRDRHPAIAEVADALGEFVGRYSPASFGVHPQQGSPFESESEQLPTSARAGAGSLLAHAEMAVQIRMLAAMDFMGGTASLAKSSASVYSVFALTRSAMESFAYAAWILEPGIGAARRACRGALDHADGVDQYIKNLQRLQEPGAPDETSAIVASAIGGNEEKLRHINADLSAARGLASGQTVETYPSKRAVVNEIVSVSDANLSSGAVQYGYLSGIAHSGLAELMELHAGEGMLENFNIRVDRYLLPLAMAICIMRPSCDRFAASWGLPSAAFDMDALLEVLDSNYRLHGDEPAFT